MYSTEDREPPIILFAGRPIVSAKGLATLADALLILERLHHVPKFVLWIVGGSLDERAFLERFADGHPGLAVLRREGRCLIWGHVEGEALAELYSRSSVTVVPSLFEQFGLVAVEAMACGCPVVASRTGGLVDTVVPGLTGELVPVDSPQSLANALTGYLRNPQKTSWHGENSHLWVRHRFATEIVYSRLYDVVAHGVDLGAASPAKTTTADWREVAVSEAMPSIEAFVGRRVTNAANLSGEAQTGARITTDDGDFHVKIVHAQPLKLTTIFPLPRRLKPTMRPSEIIHKYRVLEPSGLTPRLAGVSGEHGLIVTEWCQPAPDPSFADCLALMGAFADYGRPLMSQESRRRFSEALSHLAREGTEAALEAFDDASAEINAPLTGASNSFHRTHPQVELFRIALYLERPTWALAPEIAARMQGVVHTMLTAHPFVVQSPELCHGSLKAAAVLVRDGRAVACDLDNALFAVGPLDLIYWSYNHELLSGVPFAFTLNSLRSRISEDQEFLLAAMWLLVFVLHQILERTVHGDPDGANRFSRYLVGFPEAAFRTGLIPSPGPADAHGPA